jgi:hypothetical protein
MTEAKKATPAARKAEDAKTTASNTDEVVVSDKAVDLPENTEAAANEARHSEPGDELKDVNPATAPGDNLAYGATLTKNPAALPGSGTGYHCGMCGQPISSNGEHYDGNGDVAAAPHANVIVVADNWPEQQAEDNERSAEAFQQRAAEKKAATETKTSNVK